MFDGCSVSQTQRHNPNTKNVAFAWVLLTVTGAIIPPSDSCWKPSPHLVSIQRPDVCIYSSKFIEKASKLYEPDSHNMEQTASIQMLNIPWANWATSKGESNVWSRNTRIWFRSNGEEKAAIMCFESGINSLHQKIWRKTIDILASSSI